MKDLEEGAMKKQLVRIFSERLNMDEKDIKDDISSENTSSWDSLGMVTIITAIEKEFGVELTFNDLQRFTSFGEIYKLLKEKKGGCNGE